MNGSKLFLLIAVLCFVLASLGVDVAGLRLELVGLAFFAAAGLV